MTGKPRFVLVKIRTRRREEGGGLPGAAALKCPRDGPDHRGVLAEIERRSAALQELVDKCSAHGNATPFDDIGILSRQLEMACSQEQRVLPVKLCMPDGRVVVHRCKPEDNVWFALVVPAARGLCVDPSVVRLLSDGEHLRAGQTIEAAHREGSLSDGSKVDVMLEQKGGGTGGPE